MSNFMNNTSLAKTSESTQFSQSPWSKGPTAHTEMSITKVSEEEFARIASGMT